LRVVFAPPRQYGWGMEGTSIPVRRSRARTQAAANRIRQQILSGAWRNGRLLPSERDLAAEFGIARNTLRRIIRQLEAEGLIESQPGRGSVVRLSPLGDQMSRADILPTPHASQAGLTEMRTLLAPLVAELAASRATAEDISAMETALQKATDATETAAREHWDAELHLAIWRATRNTALVAWYEAIRLECPRRIGTPEVRSGYLREQAAIIAAVRNRNPDLASELMRSSVMHKRESESPRLPVEA
jgi:GntR family transcriptional regulator, uxu operon transcriptional repressor